MIIAIKGWAELKLVSTINTVKLAVEGVHFVALFSSNLNRIEIWHEGRLIAVISGVCLNFDEKIFNDILVSFFRGNVAIRYFVNKECKTL